MESTPLISIIMPVYNVAPYIKKSIQSVLSQTYTNFELLIIDDGTPDDSMDIARDFQQNDERIHLHHKKNGGLSDARNYGMQYVKGDYIYFLDSDDWIEPDLLSVGVNSLLKNNDNIVIFGYYADTEDSMGKLVDTKEVTHSPVVFEKGGEPLAINTELLSLMGYAWNKMYNAEFIRKHNFTFDKGISLVEDMLFNAKVLGATDRILVIENPLYHYMNREVETLIKTFHQNSFELVVLKISAIKEFLEKWKVSKEEKYRVISASLLQGIRYCTNNLFAFKNQLKFKEKQDYIKMMVEHADTRRYIDAYQTISFSDKLYKVLIKKRCNFILSLICLIKK